MGVVVATAAGFAVSVLVCFMGVVVATAAGFAVSVGICFGVHARHASLWLNARYCIFNTGEERFVIGSRFYQELAAHKVEGCLFHVVPFANFALDTGSAMGASQIFHFKLV